VPSDQQPAPGRAPADQTQDDIMTSMSPTKYKAQLLHREQRAAVYRSKVVRSTEPMWRDIVAGAVFFIVLCIGIGVTLVGGLLVFG
jgi:hypothetical protein